jgi:hypothetical protein
MNSSRSFDRAADIYDQTRFLLEPIATHGFKPSSISSDRRRAFWM